MLKSKENGLACYPTPISMAKRCNHTQEYQWESYASKVTVANLAAHII